MNKKHTLVLRIAAILLLMTAGWSPRAYAAALGQEGDPKSPHPTPTWTPTFLPMPTLEPSPTDTPPPDVTATPLTLPTDTPVIMPTDTPLPVDTPPLPPPASGEPVPSATPQLILPPPPFGPTPTATLTNTAPISSTLLLPGASVPLRKRINPVLFIDNLVVAMGYVWLCFATLAILAAAIGAILWVTRRRARTADIPALSPAPDATPPAAPDATPPAAPTTPRVAARRNAPRPPDNFD